MARTVGPFPCKYCGKHLSRKDHLRNHQDGKKRDGTDICPKKAEFLANERQKFEQRLQRAASAQRSQAEGVGPSNAGTRSARPRDEPTPPPDEPSESNNNESDEAQSSQAALVRRLEALNIPSASKIAFEVVRLFRLTPSGDPALKETAKVVEQIKSDKTLEELVRIADLEHFRDEDGMDYVICPCCYDPEQGNSRVGKFAITQSLKNLKASVKHHFEHDVHAARLEARCEDMLMLKRQKKTGMILARLALQTIREARSYRQFEYKVLGAHLNGCDVGTLGHSREFCRAMIKSLDHVTLNRIKSFLHGMDPVTRRPMVFAGNFDKMTNLHRTGQMHGVFVFDAGRIKAIFTAHSLVRAHDGFSLMRTFYEDHLMNDLGFTRPQLRQQLAAAASDGAYIKLGCGAHLAVQHLCSDGRDPSTMNTNSRAVQKMKV